MESNKNPVHNLIPEKDSNFSVKKGLYFGDFLKEFEGIFEASVSEFRTWEDETLNIMLNKKGIRLTQLDFHKLVAYNNFHYERCYVTTPLEFRNIALVINDEVPITNSLETIDPAYVAWAIEVLERHDTNNEIELTDEVAMYIAICFHEDGFLFMPETLAIFNGYLEQTNTNNPGEIEEVSKTTNDLIKALDIYVTQKREELN